MIYFLCCLLCWAHHAGHAYGAWQYGMGPNGYYLPYRVCEGCDWVQTPERISEG
jgi:hypothetical protein